MMQQLNLQIKNNNYVLLKAELISITGDTGAAMAVLVYEWFALSKKSKIIFKNA